LSPTQRHRGPTSTTEALDAEREALIEDFLEGFEQGGGLVVSRGRRRGALRAEVLRWNAQEGFKLYPDSSRMH
jgi:hypothetical protein